MFERDCYSKKTTETRPPAQRVETEPTFTISQIKEYLLKSDSLGDAIYFLSAKKILEANQEQED